MRDSVLPDERPSCRVLPWLRVSPIAGLLVVSLAVRLLFVALFPAIQEYDYLAYLTMATNLYEGRGLIDMFHNYAFYNSGYPFFIYGLFCLFGKSLQVVLLANVVLSTVSVLLVYRIALAVFQCRKAAFGAALLWAVYLPNIRYTAYAAKENLMTPVLLSQVWLAALYAPSNRKNILLTVGLGITTGIQAMVGSAGLAIVPALLIPMLCVTKRLASIAKHLVIMALCAGVTVAPWLYRNYQIFGEVLLNTNGGFNFYLGNNPSATGWYIGIDETPVGSLLWNELRDRHGEHVAAEYVKSLAIDYIRSHPLDAARLSLKKLLLFWLPPAHDGRNPAPSLLERASRRIWLIEYLFVVGLALFAVPRMRIERHKLLLLVGSIVLYSLLHAVFYIIVRYRLPIMPLVCVGAGYSLTLLLETLVRPRSVSAPAVKAQLFVIQVNQIHDQQHNQQDREVELHTECDETEAFPVVTEYGLLQSRRRNLGTSRP